MDDLIRRQAAIDALSQQAEEMSRWSERYKEQRVGILTAKNIIEDVPSAQKKGYTKADYVMALHKEYGCSLARAEEAHQKSLEYLRNTSMMKG